MFNHFFSLQRASVAVCSFRVSANLEGLQSKLLTSHNITESSFQCRGVRAQPRTRVLHKEIFDKYTKQKNLQGHVTCPGSSTESDPDMPVVNMENPYTKPAKRCILCMHNVDLDYKNTRLLSQFTSPHTGRIYGRHITGLCLFMQKRVAKLINRSRIFGFMPYMHKDPRFLRDPKLFDPFRRKS